jgi:hypothetical protein
MGQQANEWFSYTTDARLRALSWVSPKFARWAALLCLALPVIFYFLYFLNFHPTVSGFARRAQANVSNLQYVFRSDAACKVPAFEGSKDGVATTPGKVKPTSPEDREILVKAQDFHGRYSFSIPSAFLQFLSILGVLFALSAIGRRTSFGGLATIGFFVCLGGAFSHAWIRGLREI